MSLPKRQRFRFAVIGLIFGAAALGGCVSTPTQPDKAPVAVGPTFYPSPPNPPRIQYLTTIASERDLTGKKDALADFILGEERNAQTLSQPYGIAMFGSKLYVADTGAGGLAVFDLALQRHTLFTGSSNGRFKKPINIRIDRDGTKYVTDTGRDQILVYAPDDRYLGAFGTAEQFRPVDVAIAGERLYVTDIKHHEVQVLDKRSGQLLFKFGKAGTGIGELFQPTNLAIGPQGDIFVVDTGNYRVQRFTPEGTPVSSFGSVGQTLGSFARPKGIAIDRTGRIYVGDAAFQNVQIFNDQGKLLLFFRQSENPDQALNLPSGVTIDYANVAAFRRFAAPKFEVEYLIMVASQFGPNKVDIFGFGRMAGMDYPPETPAAVRPAP